MTTTTTWPGTLSPGTAIPSPGGSVLSGGTTPPRPPRSWGGCPPPPYPPGPPGGGHDLHRRRDDDGLRGPGAAGRHDVFRRDRAAQLGREPGPCHACAVAGSDLRIGHDRRQARPAAAFRSEEHTSELQSPVHLV